MRENHFLPLVRAPPPTRAPSDALSETLPTSLAETPPGRRGVGVVLWQIVTAVEFRPRAPPVVPAELPEMSPLLRIHACLGLFLGDVEYALSPGGQLRGLAKWTCRICVALGLLAGTLAVAFLYASAVLGMAVVISGQLVAMLRNLLDAALLLLGLLGLGLLLVLVVRIFHR